MIFLKFKTEKYVMHFIYKFHKGFFTYKLKLDHFKDLFVSLTILS